MKLFLFLVLIVSNISCGQKITPPSSEIPVIFFSGQYETSGESKSVDFLYTKTFVKDTSVNGAEFKKFKWDKFRNYKDAHEVYYEFERITDDEYILLDEKLQNIHNLKLKPEQQKGILFGIEGNIGYEYIDTRTYSPKSNFAPDAHSPMRFFLTEDKNIFIYYETDRKKIDVTMNKGDFKKSLTEGGFGLAAQILSRNDSLKTSFDIELGDELQLVYTTERVEFSFKGTIGKDNSQTGEQKKLPVSKEITSMKCTGVKKDGTKKIIFMDVIKFNSEKNKIENSPSQIEIEENGNVIMDGQIIAQEQTYKLDFKLDSIDVSQIPDDYKENVKSKYLFSFMGLTYDTLSGKLFPKALYINSVNYYQMYYLTYFPIPYAEYPGTTGRIAYVKLKGKEYGKKE